MLKHYPMRSEEHARRKVEQERHGRRSAFEWNVHGFHRQYEALAASDFQFESETDLIEFNDDFWKNYGLLIMTDLLSSRVRRGWMPGSK
jgi:calcineurin-like phosphoesterase family protein